MQKLMYTYNNKMKQVNVYFFFLLHTLYFFLFRTVTLDVDPVFEGKTVKNPPFGMFC